MNFPLPSKRHGDFHNEKLFWRLISSPIHYCTSKVFIFNTKNELHLNLQIFISSIQLLSFFSLLMRWNKVSLQEG